MDRATARAAMERVLSGQLTPVQVAGLAVALRAKGGTADEITGMAEGMISQPTPVELDRDTVDIVGTGGDRVNTVNVSTMAALVAAGAGAKVVKHGNRAASSACGAADCLEALGVGVDIDPKRHAAVLEEIGLAFLFAPWYHASLRYAAPARKELGIQTTSNLLGPLTNPAGAPNQVLGVYSAELVPLMAEVLRKLGSRHVMVVHSDDGLDEISLAAPTQVAELKEGEITRYTIAPEALGIERQSLAALKATSAEDSLRLVKAALSGEGAAADIVALNAGAALYCAGIADSLKEGVMVAQDAQASKLPLEKLRELSHFTSVFKG